MPGVTVTSGTISGPSAPARAPSSTYMVAGLADRGPVDKPVRVFSAREFIARFGDRPSYGSLWDDVRTFFEEGGTRAYILRVVGPAATTGALAAALADRAAVPEDTLTVSASSPGAWSSRVSVEVLDGPTADTFKFRVLLDDVAVEEFSNLRSPQEAVSRINERSLYVRLADAASTSAAPENNPVAVGPVALAAGTDDRAAVTSTHYTAALAKFTEEFGDGAIALPGVGDSVHEALIEHADTYNRLALLSHARGTSVAILGQYAATLDAKRAGLFAPWVQIPDDFGGRRAISPEGYVAACRAKAHEFIGPWKAAAGEQARASFVLQPDQLFTAEEADGLDSAKVNVVRSLAGSTRLYGWRSLSEDTENWAYLTGADVINRIVVEAAKQCEAYVFGVIDSSGHLLASLTGTLIGIVKPMSNAGGLFHRLDDEGSEIDPGYRVIADETLNPVESLAQSKILAMVAVRVAPSAALVEIQVSKAGVTAAL